MKLTVHLTVHFPTMSSAFSNLPHDGWWLYERQVESHNLFAYIDTGTSAFSFVYAGIRR